VKTRRRKKRRNPGSYWSNFALAAAAIVGVLYVARRNPKLFGAGER
jgi:hypothetical protein